MPAAWTSTCWWTRPSRHLARRRWDVGTGAGHTALALAPHVRLVLALDITPEMLAEARRLGAANGVANLRLVEGAVEAVPVRPRSCDIVTCRVAAHHFRAADKAIAEMARVLRPGGRLLLVDNYAPDRPELDAFINRLEVLRDPSHVREHTLAQWQGFMAAADLRVEIRALDCIRLEFADWVRRSQTPPGRGATAAGDAVIGIAGGRPHVRHHGRAAVDVLALAVHCGRLCGLTGVGRGRFPRLTNEVQHQSKVLPWDVTTRSLVLKTGVNWPVYTAQGASLRQIATALDRAPSTIARELKRNTSRQQGYQPRYAQEQARARRWGGARLDRDAALRARVLARLKHGWSPEQIAGRLRREAGQTVIAHETIYRFIYAQTTRTKPDRAWRHYLPRAKWRRGWRGRRGGSAATRIRHRRPLEERPPTASDRQTPGHWEADLMLFRTYGQAVLTVHERHSRLLLAVRPPGKAATPIAAALARLLGPLPAPWRQTVTFDNGTEFARHHQLHPLGIETFCCDTHAPWQQGGGRKRHRAPAPRAAPQARLGGPGEHPVYGVGAVVQ